MSVVCALAIRDTTGSATAPRRDAEIAPPPSQSPFPRPSPQGTPEALYPPPSCGACPAPGKAPCAAWRRGVPAARALGGSRGCAPEDAKSAFGIPIRPTPGTSAMPLPPPSHTATRGYHPPPTPAARATEHSNRLTLVPTTALHGYLADLVPISITSFPRALRRRTLPVSCGPQKNAMNSPKNLRCGPSVPLGC